MTNTYIWSWIRFQLQVLIRFCRKIWTFMLAHSSCSCFSNNFKCANSCESGICFLGSDYSKHNTMYITPPDLVKQLIPFSVPTCKESMRFAKKKSSKFTEGVFLDKPTQTWSGVKEQGWCVCHWQRKSTTSTDRWHNDGISFIFMSHLNIISFVCYIHYCYDRYNRQHFYIDFLSVLVSTG